MRSKAPLVLMEQTVMLLVFALAAALCLQAFAVSQRISKEGEARDRAVLLCQNAAEIIQSAGGDMETAAEMLGAVPGDGAALCLYLQADWTPSPTPDGPRRLLIQPVDSGVTGLGKACVTVVETESGNTIFQLETAWQEGGGGNG